MHQKVEIPGQSSGLKSQLWQNKEGKGTGHQTPGNKNSATMVTTL